MNLVRAVLFGWMFYLMSAFGTDESISFSPIKLDSKSTKVSYWYGNISLPRETSLLRESINIQLYLNQRQGLLFYTIDSQYRTLWVELKEDLLEVNYYNILIHETEKRIYKYDKLCNRIPDSNIDLTFRLEKSEIFLNCNGNIQPVDYVEPPDVISKDDFTSMTNSMVLPIPDFSNINETQNNVVHMWIGNTPSVNDERFKNTKLISYPVNLHGCVELITIKKVVLNLASSGVPYGEMLTSFCKPVCTPTLCLNNGKCKETWRGRFKCECGPSQYVGKVCNESYSLKFNGLMDVRIGSYFKLQKMRFSFQPIIYGESPGLKLLSIKFLQNQFLHVFIDKGNYLIARFLRENEDSVLIGKFETRIRDNHNYTLSIDTEMDVIYFKISWIIKSGRLQTEQAKIQTNQNNLIAIHIIIGDSHAETMRRASKFIGCISNFLWQSGSKKYFWNEMHNFSLYPQCGETQMLTTTILSRKLAKDHENTESLSTSQGRGKLNSGKNIKINYSHMTFIAIAIAILIIGFLISIIIIYKCREIHYKKEKTNVNSDKEKLQLSYLHKPNESMDSPYAVTPSIHPTFPKTSFKPAYKARSMSSSTNGRSMLSLPLSVTPTLVTPEGEIL